MESKLKDVLVYALLRCKDNKLITKKRLEVLIYLADWKNAYDTGKQITDIKWKLSNKIIESGKIFEILENEKNIFMFYKNNYNNICPALINEAYVIKNLSIRELENIEFAVEETKDLSFSAFAKKAYSTYPITLANSKKEIELDLTEAAKTYRKYLEEKYRKEKDNLVPTV